MSDFTETLRDVRFSGKELNNLERLGAYFTSQIHDLNNQMAILSNAELLLQISNLPTTPEMAGFLQRIFSTIQRLSMMCEHFNQARKAYPLEMEKVSVEEARNLIFGVVGDVNGWTSTNSVLRESYVQMNSKWIPTIISQMIRAIGTEKGKVFISVGNLPPRHYCHSPRSKGGMDGKLVFLVHLIGHTVTRKTKSHPQKIDDLSIALELIRLSGAGFSRGLTDDPHDYLLAFPVT